MSNELPVAMNASGTSSKKVFWGESQMFMRPRDIARFGQHFELGGDLDGVGGEDAIISAQWIGATTKDVTSALASGNPHHGCWWWREYSGGNLLIFQGHEGYCARGYGGQHVCVFPTLNLVVITTSRWTVSESASDLQTQENEELLTAILNSISNP